MLVWSSPWARTIPKKCSTVLLFSSRLARINNTSLRDATCSDFISHYRNIPIRIQTSMEIQWLLRSSAVFREVGCIYWTSVLVYLEVKLSFQKAFKSYCMLNTVPDKKINWPMLFVCSSDHIFFSPLNGSTDRLSVCSSTRVLADSAIACVSLPMLDAVHSFLVQLLWPGYMRSRYLCTTHVPALAACHISDKKVRDMPPLYGPVARTIEKGGGGLIFGLEHPFSLLTTPIYSGEHAIFLIDHAHNTPPTRVHTYVKHIHEYIHDLNYLFVVYANQCLTIYQPRPFF